MRSCTAFVWLFGALFLLAPPGLSAAGDGAFLGRWDITMPAKEKAGARYCWLEVTREGGRLKGRFNQGGGAVFDLPRVAVEKGELQFEYPVGRAPNESRALYSAQIKGGKLEGTATIGREAARPWVGVRAPKWPAKPPKRKPGKPIALFNGTDLAGWAGQIPGRPLGWSVQNGVMVNSEPKANNIYTEQKFRDFRLEVEFNMDKGSNSGIYLRGRYEIQLADTLARPPDVHSQGALYGFTTPKVHAEKPAGEWQTFDITLIANRLTVILNGVKLLEDEEVPGITGGALDANEGDPGPIMLQGDHGKVQLRKVLLTPLN